MNAPLPPEDLVPDLTKFHPALPLVLTMLFVTLAAFVYNDGAPEVTMMLEVLIGVLLRIADCCCRYPFVSWV
jgi:hypothetical protein